jgi:hypothetical protein
MGQPSTIYCVVEGKTDEWFLTHVAALLGKTLISKKNFHVTNGYDAKFIENAFPFIEQAQKNGFRPVVFADADSNFQTRSQELNIQLTASNLGGTPVFLFPDNNSVGALENLIFSTVPAQHRGILACFDNYNNCINGYTQADNKSKLYAYSEATSQLNKDKSIDFRNATFWNLSQTSIPALYQFLGTHL